MFGEPVHRNRHPAARQADPLSGNRNHSAGDDQHKHSTSAEFRQNAAEFGMSHERLAADQRYMQRLMFLDQLEDTRDERVAAQIRQFTERVLSPQVRIAVGITTRTAEWTFACDFNRQQRCVSIQDAAPSSHQLTHSEPGTRFVRHAAWMHSGALRDQYLLCFFVRPKFTPIVSFGKLSRWKLIRM